MPPPHCQTKIARLGPDLDRQAIDRALEVSDLPQSVDFPTLINPY